MTDEVRAMRQAVIVTLAARWPGGIGRTALMKAMYFLQTLRGVPLGYRFTLYTYGPYDAEVLADAALAVGAGRLTSTLKTYKNGNQGYVLKAGRTASDAAARHREHIDWVVERFGKRTAADLEMASTIVFADRSRNGRAVALDELARQVHEIKPHLDLSRISTEAAQLKSARLLQSAA